MQLDLSIHCTPKFFGGDIDDDELRKINERLNTSLEYPEGISCDERTRLIDNPNPKRIKLAEIGVAKGFLWIVRMDDGTTVCGVITRVHKSCAVSVYVASLEKKLKRISVNRLVMSDRSAV